MELKKGICSECGHDTVIVNRTRMLCDGCNYRRLHGGMSRAEVARKRRKPRNRQKTGELDLFIEIWGSRPHYCVKCGKWLGNEPKPVFFSHIKSKGARPDLRLDPNNIELLCEECHYKYEFGKRNEL